MLNQWNYSGILQCLVAPYIVFSSPLHLKYLHFLQIFGGAKNVNVSHVIHDLSFGPKYPGIHNPLDGTVRMLHDTSGTFKYYIKVWPWFCCWFSDRVVILDLILSCDISYTILGGLIFLDQGIYIHWPKTKCIYFIFSELFIVACPEILFLLGCRLFLLNTDTSPKMFCLQINSL